MSHDAGRTRYNGNEKILTAGNVQNLQPVWQTAMSSRYALVWNGFVITLNPDGQFQNFAIKDGTPGVAYGSKAPYTDFGMWSVGRLYTVEGQGEFLAAYDALGGQQIFRQTHNRPGDSLVVDADFSVVSQSDGTVLLGTVNNTNSGAAETTGYALSGQDGTVKWAVKTGVGSNWALTGKVGILNNYGTLTGYDLVGGKQLWQTDTKLPTVFMAAQDTVFAVNTVAGAVTEGPVTVNAYNAQTGKARWTKKFDGKFAAQLLGTNGKQLFVNISDATSKQNTIYALDAINGNQLWKLNNPSNDSNPRPASALIDNLFFVADGNKVRVIETATGKVNREITTDQPNIDWLAVAEGRLLVSGNVADKAQLTVYGLPS